MTIDWTWGTLSYKLCPYEKKKKRLNGCCVTGWKQANALSLKSRRLWDQLSSSLLFFFLSLSLHSLVSQPPWFMRLSGELWFLKGFSMSLIPPSLCVQAKNISAWNSRGQKTSCFPKFCENKSKKLWKIKTHLASFCCIKAAQSCKLVISKTGALQL